MSALNKIKESIIEAVLIYDLKALHHEIINLVNEIENSEVTVEPQLLNEIFVAYERHDYLYLSDLVEHGLY